MPLLAYRSCARSDVGKRRAENQDRVLDRPEARLWAVADGMGGHAEGGRAAALVVGALAGVDHGASGYACLAEIERRVAAVNDRLFAEGREGGRSGSTLVALLAHEGHVACLWAGDSRAYLLRDRALSRLTRDHSVVQELIDGGAIPEAARRDHPHANIVTRAIGGSAALALERRFLPVGPGDRLLLCSDGLTLCLGDAELAAALSAGALADAADALLAQALARGAPDNVSLVAVEVC